VLLSNALFPTLNLERPFKEGPDVNDSPTFRVNRTQHVSVTKQFRPKNEAERTQPNASGGVEGLSGFSPCYYEYRLHRELLTGPAGTMGSGAWEGRFSLLGALMFAPYG